MNKYFIRTIAADYPQLMALGQLLGVIEVLPAMAEPFEQPARIHALGGGFWDFIGPIDVPTGEFVSLTYGPPVPVMAPLRDSLGHEYIHVNIQTPVNLKEAATALAQAHPEVAAGLANLGKYFLLDAEGNARAPSQPHREFAT